MNKIKYKAIPIYRDYNFIYGNKYLLNEISYIASDKEILEFDSYKKALEFLINHKKDYINTEKNTYRTIQYEISKITYYDEKYEHNKIIISENMEEHIYLW